ncbi:hypothetical protein HO173_006809 [Letharia columbiana]|uniref:Uncharacterized protein n=1 Tax=Letharia columbiana TaxID=112416 RepID=A0A8H6L4F0_9LECA|nr:uncharacterized protein HO173_006809 [Letharia columbiana]KAF6235180.1 hypothetical protein HO173_006809 [Letharia columbiana]
MGNQGTEGELTRSDFMKELEVEPSSEGYYVNVQPMWSFNNWGIVPGALLMPQCVAASYRTVPRGFHTHSVQTHFLGNGTVTKRATYRVENLNDGKTFATRQVKVEQDGKTIALTTVGFAKRASVAGRGAAVVEHAVPVVMRFDTFVGTPTLQSRDMRCQSLPKVCPSPAAESKLARHWLRADGPVSTEKGNMQNVLGLVALSDIFLLDSAPRIYGLGFDLKTEKSPSERLARDLKAMTTINHSIHIVNVDAARVDEWVYVECETPWASSGRIMVHSRMFSRDGILLATCAQEGLLLLRKSASDSIARQKL